MLAVLCVSGCRKSTPPANPGPKAAEPSAKDSADRSSPSTTEVVVAKPDSEYVGSEVCNECHSEISAKYAGHAMGKSAAAISSSVPFPPATESQFEADGFQYEMRQREQDWVHTQRRLGDASGSATVELPVSHLIGSGKNGQSFLVSREGRLFMSPMTWYPAKGVWDLSPGYETNNSQFNRPVIEECLYCHTDGAHAIAHTMNRYGDPIVRDHVIGCERCHGPGGDHVARMEAAEETPEELSIVNPASLSPELREAVCQQCHLSGAVRVLKPHRRLNDYRPGQPLAATYTDFTLAEDGKEFVGHVEQMYNSKCFQGSQGKLGCISCHDPHSLPAADERITFYRHRCLECHGEEDATSGCSLDLATRQTESPQDNCMQCHMPRLPTEVQHAAVTDHAIPRIPGAAKNGPGSSSLRQLVAFPDSSVATVRAKSMALVSISSRHPELLGADLRGAVLRNLESVVAADADDFDAVDALATVYLEEGRVEDALQVCRQVLAKVPQRESTLQIVCETYSQTGQHQKATTHWEQLLGVNPWMSNYWFSLGRAYAASNRWARCQQLAVEGKKRFPTSMGLRHLLVESYLQLGDPDAAEAEFQAIESFGPPKFDSLRQWYQSHPLRK